MRIFSRIRDWFRMSDSNNNNEQQSRADSLVREFEHYMDRRRTLGYGSLGGTNPMYLSNWLTRVRSDGYFTDRLREDTAADRIAQGAKEACERVDAYNALRYVYSQLKHEQLNISNEDIDKIMIILKLVDSLSYKSKADRTAALDWLIRVATFCAQEKEENKGTDDFEL